MLLLLPPDLHLKKVCDAGPFSFPAIWALFLCMSPFFCKAVNLQLQKADFAAGHTRNQGKREKKMSTAHLDVQTK
jgi:hypothetical protein